MKNLLLISLLAFGAYSYGQNTVFQALLSKDVVGVNENFTLSFKLNSSGSEFKPPDLSQNFRVLSGPNQSSQMSIVNGKVSSSLIFSYVLAGINPGQYKIDAASIKAGGKTYKTQPVSVKVVKTKSDQQQGTSKNKEKNKDKDAKVGNDLFLKLVVSKKKVFLGEQLVVTYKLYNRLYLNGIEGQKLPEFVGFYTSDVEIKKNNGYSREQVNNKIYDVYIIKQSILIPQKSGKLKLKPLEIDANINIQEKTPVNTIFGPKYRYVQKTVKIKSNAETIKVLPLPSGAPASFNGAVGQYQISTEMSPEKIKVNDAVNYTIKLTGSGNIPLAEAPPPIWPVDFEGYDPKLQSNINNESGKIRGTKKWDFLLIARHAGNYKIPAIHFSYFDPTTKEYVTLSGNPYSIEVLPDDGNNGEVNTKGSAYRKDVERLGTDIRFIHTKAPKLREKDERFFGTLSYYFLLILPAVLSLLIYLLIRKQKALQSNTLVLRQRKATKMASKRLQEAKKLLDQKDTSGFYEEIFKALNGYLADKMSIQRSNLNKEFIQQKLSEKNVLQETIIELLAVLNQSEMARFSPVKDATEEEIYVQSKKIIVNLENQLK